MEARGRRAWTAQMIRLRNWGQRSIPVAGSWLRQPILADIKIP